MNWQKLDAQMRRFASRLTAEVGLANEIAERLATSVATDVRFLSPDHKARIRRASPVPLEAVFFLQITAETARPRRSVGRSRLNRYASPPLISDREFDAAR